MRVEHRPLLQQVQSTIWTRRRRGVDALLENEEVNLLGVHLREEIDQVGKGPAQSIRKVSQGPNPAVVFSP